MDERAKLAQYEPLVQQIVHRFLRRLPPNVLKEDLESAARIGLLDGIRRHECPNLGYLSIRIFGSIVDELRSQDWLSRRARSKTVIDRPILWFEDLPASEQRIALGMTSEESEMDLELAHHLLEFVSERQKQVISALYFEEVTAQVLAERMGVSEPRISQLRHAALDTMKKVAEGLNLL